MVDDVANLAEQVQGIQRERAEFVQRLGRAKVHIVKVGFPPIRRNGWLDVAGGTRIRLSGMFGHPAR